jgi:4-amino-4-deoxy-L-arabinose transferase-like glycosyltransferase
VLKKYQFYLPYFTLFLLFLTTAIFRPLLPIDETRYMSVAWEMYFTKHYTTLSLNFDPYFHKPPLLFWIIVIFWKVFGVFRSVALIPIFIASALLMYLTEKFSEKLLPKENKIREIIPYLMLGSFPFLFYSSLVMFDILIGVFFIGSLIMFFEYANSKKIICIFITGFLIGCGVLTKGPVMYVYTLLPLIFYPIWRDKKMTSSINFYRFGFESLVVSFTVVLFWLIPALTSRYNHLNIHSILQQTAGRVEGNFQAAHARPFYFYLYFVPLFFMPWIFFFNFWKNIKKISFHNSNFKFILFSIIPVFISFSLISGKQVHYLLPLLPLLIIGLALLLSGVKKKFIQVTSIFLVTIIILSQIIFSQTKYYPNYNLQPLADFYNKNKTREWAFVPDYQGEIGFLGKIDKSFDVFDTPKMSIWFQLHPKGYIIAFFSDLRWNEYKNYDVVYVQNYRGKKIVVFQKKI